MRTLLALLAAAIEAFRQFATREIYAENLPPIRYEGDATDIYLA